MPSSKPVLAITQGDPAGIGPEILLKLMQDSPDDLSYSPLLVAERCALEALKGSVPEAPWERLDFLATIPTRQSLSVRQYSTGKEPIPVLDPIAQRRKLEFGHSSPADAAGALAALDAGVAAVRSGVADALITAPVSKESIARQHLPNFVGHTEYLAAGCGLEQYGRDYLMAFLAPDLQVALLSTHLPLADALAHVSTSTVLDALLCLGSHARGRIALAGLNPHAGEGGLLGEEDTRELEPAVVAACQRGLDVHGPVSADSLFARARHGEFDWVLALYHDQGLIAVKTAAFGTATNWTLGLPYLRTSVDHGTAFGIAGQGIADAKPLQAVVETTLQLLAGHLPRVRGPFD